MRNGCVDDSRREFLFFMLLAFSEPFKWVKFTFNNFFSIPGNRLKREKRGKKVIKASFFASLAAGVDKHQSQSSLFPFRCDLNLLCQLCNSIRRTLSPSSTANNWEGTQLSAAKELSRSIKFSDFIDFITPLLRTEWMASFQPPVGCFFFFVWKRQCNQIYIVEQEVRRHEEDTGSNRETASHVDGIKFSLFWDSANPLMSHNFDFPLLWASDEDNSLCANKA